MTVNMDFVVDDKEVQKMLNKSIKRLGDTEVALAEVGIAILAYNDKSWGKRWPPLAESTVENKSDQGYKGESEVRTSKLRDSLTKPGAAGQIHEITKTSLRIGSDVFYAKWNNYGSKHQPKRPMMRMTTTVRKGIKEVLARKLMPRK
jgi:hypothetical protein